LQKQSEFRLTRRVQFHETDAAGIVHFSCYFRYMEEAEHAFWRSVGLSVAPRDSPYGWPRVAVACDYRHPLRFEDEFEIRLRIAAMSERSVRYVCTIVLGAIVVAELTMTIVCVTRSSPNDPFRAVAMPAVMHERFQVSSDVSR